MEEKKMQRRQKCDFSHISIEIPKILSPKSGQEKNKGDDYPCMYLDLKCLISENELSNILMVSKHQFVKLLFG